MDPISGGWDRGQAKSGSRKSEKTAARLDKSMKSSIRCQMPQHRVPCSSALFSFLFTASLSAPILSTVLHFGDTQMREMKQKAFSKAECFFYDAFVLKESPQCPSKYQAKPWKTRKNFAINRRFIWKIRFWEIDLAKKGDTPYNKKAGILSELRSR